MNKTPFIHLMKTPLNYYIFDVNTNEMVKVTKEIYNYLNCVKNTNKLDNEYLNEDIEEKIYKLKLKGYLSDNRPKEMKHSQTDLIKYHLSENIEQITLQVTQQCNFRCTYCTYTLNDIQTNRSHSSITMSKDMALSMIDFFSNHSKNQKKVCISFYGGEPLLEFGMIKEVILYAESVFEGKDLLFSMTTNGSLLNDEIVNFLAEHNCSLTISIDGPANVHDRSKKFAKNGKGTYAIIEKNLYNIKNKFPEFFYKIIYNVVIDPRNDFEQINEIFKHEIFKNSVIKTSLIDDYFSIEKTIPSDEYIIKQRTQSFKNYMTYLNRYSKEKITPSLYLNMQSNISKNLSSMAKHNLLFGVMSPGGPCIPGQRRLFVTVKGDFLPCEKVNETSDAMTIGNISNGFDYQKIYNLLNISKITEDECKNCWAIRHCLTCARMCDNNGELSKEMKLNHCKSVYLNTENKFKEYLLLKEFAEEN